MAMSEANFCDKCGDLFAGPPRMQLITASGEFDLGPECSDHLSNWFDEEPEPEQARPTTELTSGD